MTLRSGRAPKLAVIALINEMADSSGCHVDCDSSIDQTVFDSLEFQLHDDPQVIWREVVEDDGFVDPVDEFRSESHLDRVLDSFTLNGDLLNLGASTETE